MQGGNAGWFGRTYERRDINGEELDESETETSSIIRIRKEDGDKKINVNAAGHGERADTVLYLREINKCSPGDLATFPDKTDASH